MIMLSNYGYGDVLYNLIIATYIKDYLGYDKEILFFGPQSANELYKYFDFKIVHFNSSSSMIYKPFNVINPILKARNHSDKVVYSVLTDRIDYAFALINNSSMINSPNLDNFYFSNQEKGVRASINKIFRKIKAKDNQKHILKRHYLLCNEINKKDPVYFTEKLQKIAKSKLLSNERTENFLDYLIFPDARKKEKCMNYNQLTDFLENISGDKEAKIITNNKEIEIDKKNVEVLPIVDIKTSINLLINSKNIICADSFIAHLSGLLGLKTFVLYNHENKYFESKFEYWGPPFKNVTLIKNDVHYSIGNNFKAKQVKAELFP